MKAEIKGTKAQTRWKNVVPSDPFLFIEGEGVFEDEWLHISPMFPSNAYLDDDIKDDIINLNINKNGFDTFRINPLKRRGIEWYDPLLLTKLIQNTQNPDKNIDIKQDPTYRSRALPLH